ncbi:MAG TPA: glycosyltransferase family 4 protein [Candidatus Saccharimonadia bacterium]|nr:glycosyltransferase family 4 protein [Candidatus Saccharimonadia bacterium]
MKIGLVLDDTLDTPDGVQQYVLQVGTWLSDQGHEVHYLVGQTTRTDVLNIHSLSRNLQVRFNGNRMSMPLPANRRKLRQFLREMQFDVLHVQVPYSPFMAGRLLAVAPASTAVIGTFHILPYSTLVTLANRVLALMNLRSGKRFDKLLSVSAPAQRFAKRIYGYQSTVLPNPVRLEQFASAQNTNADLTVVFLGRLVERKGAMHLLRALAYLCRHELYSGNFRMIIGGKGELRGELERFVAENDLSNIVQFAGFVAEEAKATFLAQADIAVYPSIGGESFGIVLLEAMAAARGVVIGGDNPGYASVLQPYPDQLIDPNDTRQFAEKLAWYLENPIGRERAALLQKEYVQHFDINEIGRQLLHVYEQALQSRRQS